MRWRLLIAPLLALMLVGCTNATATSTNAPAPSSPSIAVPAPRGQVKRRSAGPFAGAHHRTGDPVSHRNLLAYSTASATVFAPQRPERSCQVRGTGLDELPDPACTPGALNPAVTPRTEATTICRAGWTATVRPPEDITEPEKLASMRAYGIAGHSPGDYEYDHLVPLELGGAVNDPRNLWPEPDFATPRGYDHNPKDAVEFLLRNRVCSGTLSLRAAQLAIASDWLTAAKTTAGRASSSSPLLAGVPASSRPTGCRIERAAYSARYHDFAVVLLGPPGATATVTAAGYSDRWSTGADGAADVYLHAPASLAGQPVRASVGPYRCRGTLTG
jgi:hypothetical protein